MCQRLGGNGSVSTDAAERPSPGRTGRGAVPRLWESGRPRLRRGRLILGDVFGRAADVTPGLGPRSMVSSRRSAAESVLSPNVKATHTKADPDLRSAPHTGPDRACAERTAKPLPFRPEESTVVTAELAQHVYVVEVRRVHRRGLGKWGPTVLGFGQQCARAPTGAGVHQARVDAKGEQGRGAQVIRLESRSPRPKDRLSPAGNADACGRRCGCRSSPS